MRFLDIFNPERTNQDSQEFLSLCLDTLHEELKLLDITSSESETKVEWEQTGQIKNKVLTTKEEKQTSIIEEIFGGIFT
jgi:ubiquitin C-terminal hydrolase